jgi:gluconolactonase
MLLDPATGKVEPYLQTWRSESFRGVNDLIFASNGDLYFTDQGQTGLHDASGRVFRLRHTGQDPGVLECLLSCGPSPNGLTLNVAENQLYVAMTRDNAIWRLPLQADGGVSKVGRFIQMSGGVGPDGIALDERGGIAVAHPGTTVWRFDAVGRPSHAVELPPELAEPAYCTNLAYGGEDNQTLYIVESVTGLILKASIGIAGRKLFSHHATG